MQSNSSGAHCPACGERRPGNYCPNCGMDQSPENRRHFSVMRKYQRAAVTAAKKAEMDREVYGPGCPPMSCMVVRAAEALAENRDTFPAVRASVSEDGLWVEKVREMALDVWERRRQD